MNDRLDSLNYLRGIAAIIVLWAHFTLPPLQFLDCNIYSYNNFLRSSSEFLNKIKIFNGAIGVYIFFLISGFVISMSLNKIDVKTFIIRRIFRIYPVYIIGLASFILYHYIACQHIYSITELAKKLMVFLTFSNDFILSNPRNEMENLMGVA